MKKGTRVLYPECKKHLFTVNRDVLNGERIDADFLDAAGQEPRNDVLAVSKCCFVAFISPNPHKFFTENGWEAGL